MRRPPTTPLSQMGRWPWAGISFPCSSADLEGGPRRGGQSVPWCSLLFLHLLNQFIKHHHEEHPEADGCLMGEGGARQGEGVWGGGRGGCTWGPGWRRPPGSVTLPGTGPVAPPVATASKPAGALVVWLSFLPPNPLLYNILVYFILFLGSLVIFKWEKYCKRNFKIYLLTFLTINIQQPKQKIWKI